MTPRTEVYLEGTRALLWGNEGAIYTYNGFPARIIKHSSTGDPPALHSRLPFDCAGQVAILPDASAVVCAVSESLTDVWVIDNFDTEART